MATVQLLVNGASVLVEGDRDEIRGQVDAGVASQASSGPPAWLDLQMMDLNTWPYEPHATKRASVRCDRVDAVNDPADV